MKPAPFAYHRAGSLDEALQLLDELKDDDCKVLAGGQSLMPVLNMRLARPSHLIDVSRLAELAYVRPTPEGGLAIGALTRHRTLEYSAEVAERLPLVAEAAPLVGDRQVRYRGTLGGSLAHADPSAELPTIVVALDAEIVISRRSGSRVVPAAEFFLGVLTTALAEDELLTEVRFPAPPAGAGQAFLELARQHGDFAIASAAAVVALEGGRVREARIALGGVAGTPVRARQAEQMLVGKELTPDVLAEAGRLAAEATDPSGDVHGSAEYRREMAGVYARRALTEAARRAAPGARKAA